MSTYYEYRDVKNKIVHRLFYLGGWKVYNYFAGESDPYTDYYSPETWNGIAEKNGYKLVIDHSTPGKERVYKAAVIIDSATKKKIEKLEQMTVERGATISEEKTAKEKIEILYRKAEHEQRKTATKEIIEPGHMANPPRCNWHIEKDGVIIDKGTGLLKFRSVPDITNQSDLREWQLFNTLTREEWETNWIECARRNGWFVSKNDETLKEYAAARYEEAKEEYELLEKFNILINRINTTCGGMVGNEKDFYTYEEKTVTEYKTELKPFFRPGEIKEGQCFILKSNFSGGCERGYIYRMHEYFKRSDGYQTYIAYRLGKGYKKERTGTGRGNVFAIHNTERFTKWVESGDIAFVELEEVQTVHEVKKVVKTKTA